MWNQRHKVDVCCLAPGVVDRQSQGMHVRGRMAGEATAYSASGCAPRTTPPCTGSPHNWTLQLAQDPKGVSCAARARAPV